MPCSLPLLWAASNAFLSPYLGLLQNTIPFLKGTFGAVSSAVGFEPSYDYVIVGGGTAGNTIAARLAEAGFTVSIVEAGGFYEVSRGEKGLSQQSLLMVRVLSCETNRI